MRKWNAILTAVVLLLFLAHGILGSFQMLGAATPLTKALSWTMTALVAVHVVLSGKLTADTLRVWKKTGAGYFRENRLFWARRISGLAVMVLLLFHVWAFGETSGGVFRLKWFDTFKLATQLLLVLTIAAHVVMNVKPMLISFGVRRLKDAAGDILFILSVLLLVMAAAFIVYYLRWNVW